MLIILDLLLCLVLLPPSPTTGYESNRPPLFTEGITMQTRGKDLDSILRITMTRNGFIDFPPGPRVVVVVAAERASSSNSRSQNVDRSNLHPNANGSTVINIQ